MSLVDTMLDEIRKRIKAAPAGTPAGVPGGKLVARSARALADHFAGSEEPEVDDNPPFHEFDLETLLADLHPDKPELAQKIQSVLSRLELYTGLSFSLTNGPYLAGGALRQAIEGEFCKTDYDIFFNSYAQYEAFSQKLMYFEPQDQTFVSKHPDLTVETQTMFTENYKMGEEGTDLIQLIRDRWYHKNAKSLISEFDFTCCQLATDGTTIVVGAHAINDICDRRLVFNAFHSPVNSVVRVGKYNRYGYVLTHEESKKFLQNVVENPDTLENSGYVVDGMSAAVSSVSAHFGAVKCASL